MPWGNHRKGPLTTRNVRGGYTICVEPPRVAPMPELPPRDVIPTIEDPSTRLVEAGARLLVDDSFAILENGLSADRVTKVAGRTRRTFYDHYPAKADYVRAVVRRYLDINDHEILNRELIATYLSQVDTHRGDITEAVKAMATFTLEWQLASNNTVLQLAGWVLGRRDPVLRPELRTHFEAVDDMLAAGFDAVLERWRLKPRPPWTTQTASAVLRAASDGAWIRRDLDPDFDVSCVVDVCLAMLAVCTQPIDEPDLPVTEHLRHLSQETRRQWSEESEPTQIANARARVLDALAVVLERRGARTITLADVAEAAGVSERIIVGTFGSVEHLMIAAIDEALPPFADEVDFDLRSGLGHRLVAERHIRRMAQFLVDRQPIMRGLLTVAMQPGGADDGAARIYARLVEPLVMILRSGRESGALPLTLGAGRTAAFATEAILARAASPAPYDPDDVTKTISDLLFGPPPAPRD
jgi:AcrR family transcriptional regulator